MTYVTQNANLQR